MAKFLTFFKNVAKFNHKHKINNSLAEKLAKNKKSESILSDDRFSRMFEEPDFNIDIRSDEYKLRHSTLGRKFSKGEK